MTTQAAPTGAPRQSRRRWLRGLLVLLLLFFGLPIGYYFYASWSLERELAEVIAETDRLDPRWRLEDIQADRKTYRDEENAALLVIKFSKLWTGSSPGAHRDYDRVFGSLPPPVQLNAQQVEIIRKAFDKYPNGLVEARKLKELAGGRFPIAYSDDWISTDTGQLEARVLFIVLAHDAMLRAHDGDLDGALESCMALAGATRSFGDEPRTIALYIRVMGDSTLLAWAVERCLAQGYPKDATMKELQQRLQRERDELRPHLVNVIRGERAGNHRLFDALRHGKLAHSAVANLKDGPRLLGWVRDKFPVMYTSKYPDLLRCMNDFVAAGQLPLEQHFDRFATLQKAFDEKGAPSVLSPTNMTQICNAHLRAQAIMAATQVGLACERFRIAHERWPESLVQLVNANLIDVVPIDPYDGLPLRLARRTDGITVYSVGKDRQDNGGKIDPDGGSAPGTDLAFRLWDPDKRRQPPRPPVALEK